MDVETSEAIGRLGEPIDALEVSLRAEFREGLREGLAENRRHSEVLFESLRDDIWIVADGFAAVSAKLDDLRR
jgi:hypothetical protein